MKLKYVKLKNFKSYPDQETKLDLDFQGIKLIVGSNGSGKSVLFDAIIWGIYGKSSATADDIINWETGKNCKVEVGFNIGNKSYCIVRYRNHEEHSNKLLFFIDKKNISQRTNGDTQEKIEEVIQISYTAMTSSVILSSELYDSFLRSKPSDRLKALESILSLKDVNEYSKNLKKLREPLIEEIEKLEVDKIKIFSSSEALASTVETYNEKIKQSLLILKEKKEENQKKVLELETRLDEFKEINVDKELKSNESYDSIKKSNESIKFIIEKEKERIKNISYLSTELNDAKVKLNELNKVNIIEETRSIEKFEEVIKDNKNITEEIEKLENKLIDCSHAELRIKQIQKNIDKLNEEIKDLLDNENICPVCKQLVNKELTERLIIEKTNEVNSFKKEMEKFDKEICDSNINNSKILITIEQLKNSYKKDLSLPKYKKDYLDKISNNILETTNIIFTLNNNIKSGEIYNNEIYERIKEQEKNIVKNLNEPKHHTLFLENLKVKINELELEAEELRSEIMIIDTKAKSSYDKEYVNETKKKIALIKTELSKIEKLLETKKIKDRYFDILSQVFSNKEVGFKKFFINKIIKIFNERINFYLPFFFDERIEISFDKDLNEIIKRNKKEVNFNSFSSGQKTRFELAITFAMFMLVKTFFSSTINVLVFDEILDRNLDVKGFNSVVEILENLGINNSIFVVSHQEFYKEKFNHHITVKLNAEGFSYIYKEV